MIVFYSNLFDGTRNISFIRYMGELICDMDISWWAIPGTLED